MRNVEYLLPLENNGEAVERHFKSHISKGSISPTKRVANVNLSEVEKARAEMIRKHRNWRRRRNSLLNSYYE
jgi:hypothetical protein